MSQQGNRAGHSGAKSVQPRRTPCSSTSGGPDAVPPRATFRTTEPASCRPRVNVMMARSTRVFFYLGNRKRWRLLLLRLVRLGIAQDDVGLADAAKPFDLGMGRRVLLQPLRVPGDPPAVVG